MSADPPRFPRLADTHADALRYYHSRATQLLVTDWTREGEPELLPWGVHVRLRLHEAVFHSLFVLTSEMGKGHLSAWRRDHSDATFVVMDACDAVTGWLDHRQIPYVVAEGFAGPEYAAISERYGDGRAERTGRYLMNHIDEGLLILRRLGASNLAMRAYCLHPLVQDDDSLARSWAEGLHTRVDPGAWTLALEYRQFANRHLSRHCVASPADIALSPLPEVADMLRADKIQNRKDFDLYHAQTHPRADRLRAYFAEWFVRLGIDEAFFCAMVDEITARTVG